MTGVCLITQYFLHVCHFNPMEAKATSKDNGLVRVFRYQNV